ncbi:DUF2243 domain-containing protein [Terribacillus saccharophilus]|uniref:DUF2243 domain-containing protein n=1 Tax=Terribacillus saccharophilus TaxID=361277 RepID=UPI002989E7CD|nr:DUF2243 domain-containing protein [Terribacillus saccharophilus]MCM3227390.1 DUF2243 domain-containing protein [Terribacillus saccharophilus]
MEVKDTYKRRNILSGFMFGVGLVAFIDEAVFHQLLHWHHFYDLSSTTWGVVSDGFFHALSWFATVGGLFLFADLRRRRSLIPLRWSGAIMLGSGVFQLYDGLIQHKLFRIHQIRYGVDIFYYDLIWNGIAVLLIAAGIWCIHLSRRKEHVR